MLIPFFSLWCYEQKTNHHNWKVGYWWCLEKWQQLQVASYSSCQSTLDLSCTLLKMASLNFPLHHTEEQLSWWSPSCLLQKEIYAHPTIHPGVSQVNKGGILDFEQKNLLDYEIKQLLPLSPWWNLVLIWWWKISSVFIWLYYTEENPIRKLSTTLRRRVPKREREGFWCSFDCSVLHLW